MGPGLRRRRHRRERLFALAALQVVGIKAQQIGGTMNEATVRTCPGRHRQRMAAGTWHGREDCNCSSATTLHDAVSRSQPMKPAQMARADKLGVKKG